MTHDLSQEFSPQHPILRPQWSWWRACEDHARGSVDPASRLLGRAEETPVEPEEVLALIHTAPERYETVCAALRYRGDGRLMLGEIRERIAHTEAGRRAFGISPRKALEKIEHPVDHPEPDGPFGWRCRARSGIGGGSGVNQHIHQTLLVLRGNGKDVDQSHLITVLGDGNHTLPTSCGFCYASSTG